MKIMAKNCNHLRDSTQVFFKDYEKRGILHKHNIKAHWLKLLHINTFSFVDTLHILSSEKLRTLQKQLQKTLFNKLCNNKANICHH